MRHPGANGARFFLIGGDAVRCETGSESSAMLENNANATVRPPDTLHYAFAHLRTEFLSVAYSPDGKSLASG